MIPVLDSDPTDASVTLWVLHTAADPSQSPPVLESWTLKLRTASKVVILSTGQ